MMTKRLYILFLICLTCLTDITFADTLNVWRANQPVVIGRRHNIVLDLSCKGDILDSIVLSLKGNRNNIKRIELYYTGTTSMLYSRTESSTLKSHQSIYGGGQKIYSNPAYSILKSSVSHPKDEEIVFSPKMNLFRGGVNYFYVSIESESDISLTDTISLEVKKAVIDGRNAVITNSGKELPVRFAVSVRDSGDEGNFGYRIPGIVTANNGTLVSVFDIRRNSSLDLQDDIQIGVSRSEDGGKTWGNTILAMDMRGTNNLPDCQNGTGDPSILTDPFTGKMYIMALWTHGLGAATSWQHCRQGFTAEEGAAQVLIVESSDYGKTWSKPYNITRQIKDSSWYILLQGPGRGITAKDGTLIFPFQYKDEKDMPAATIVYSNDKGKTWQIGSRAKENTTEAQVVQLGDNSLMLNMRDNRGGSRSVAVSRDMGKTWTEHPSSRSLLQESICMASLIRVCANDNILGKDILFFSNPNTKSGRHSMTIKASLNEGESWDYELLLDSEYGWGYSCLTMIDKNTVGILYESSKAHLLFQAIKIKDIIK